MINIRVVMRRKEMKIGFDNNKYLKMQSEHIKERIAQFDNKLYLAQAVTHTPITKR